MPQNHTKTFLQSSPDYVSPGGVADIRELINVTAGELTHVTLPPNKISRPAYVHPCSEWFYVVAGTGQLWDGMSRKTLTLSPGTCVRIPPGCPFQYRSGSSWLEFVLAALPKWEKQYHHALQSGEWVPNLSAEDALETNPEIGIGDPIEVHHRKYMPTHTAPDGSTIWELGSEDAGGLAICELPQGRTSSPVQHREVEEIWYVLQGHGELSRRKHGSELRIVALRPSTSVYVAPRETFQFRSTGTGSLVILILTMPAWPGPDEALPAAQGGAWL
ncbi:cupin domain-containing protein [Kocuria sp. M4R2S49]|uniref:cupin domain-containing protein n=1 Tax=Kocuria rhizosphaericola TaxID=3376284 RepID=UPI0037B89F4A